MAKNPEESFQEDPLEQLLDQESDEEFGLPEFKEHLADTLTPAVLRDWSAADFASIYVRFRPHLERHARRFLTNPSQVEEVVQDAFLYLMTTLPELDSELGVLKFLKWKTRLLALDVIRLNSRAKFAPIDDQFDLAADLPEMSAELERADEAAIVSLALAKLQPRHREALIASIYEEKSTEVVASQLGLSENATRQLLFRARSAFKKALVGEAETAGLTISQILSIAARRAAAESGKIIGAAGAFLLVLAISIGILPNFSAPVSEIAEPAATQAESDETPQVEITSPSTPTVELPQESAASVQISEPTADVVVAAPAASTSETAPLEPIFNTANLSTILNTNVTQAGYYTNSYASSKFLSSGFRGSSIEVFGGTGISAFLDINLNNKEIYNVIFQMWVDGKRYYAVVEKSAVDTYTTSNGVELVHRSSDFWVVDDAGNVFDQSPLKDANVTITLQLDSNNNPISAAMRVSQ